MRILVCVAALAGILLMAGCSATPLAPVVAAICIDQRGPVAVGDLSAGASRVGRAKAQGILIVSWGDASIDAAMKEGSITRIHHVDSECLGVLGVYAKYETIVYGE